MATDKSLASLLRALQDAANEEEAINRYDRNGLFLTVLTGIVQTSRISNNIAYNSFQSFKRYASDSPITMRSCHMESSSWSSGHRPRFVCLSHRKYPDSQE